MNPAELLQKHRSDGLLFETVYTTPHILAELSNLGTLRGRELEQFRFLVAEKLNLFVERHTPGLVLVAHPLFQRLGLPDAGIAAFGKAGPLVLTDDLELYLGLVNLQVTAINWNHLRLL